MVDVLPNHYDNEHFDFSPDLERGLYFAKYGILVLWDMVHQKALLEDSDFDSFGFYLRPSQVDWSPDGSQVVVSGLRLSNRDEKLYYLISKNGILITDLNNFPADEFQPVRFSWSPDSRYLAMYNRGHRMRYLSSILRRIFTCKSVQYLMMITTFAAWYGIRKTVLFFTVTLTTKCELSKCFLG